MSASKLHRKFDAKSLVEGIGDEVNGGVVKKRIKEEREPMIHFLPFLSKFYFLILAEPLLTHGCCGQRK